MKFVVEILEGSLRLILLCFPRKLQRDYHLLSMVIASTDHRPLSPNLINFLILAEDRRFYRHFGFDLIAIARALLSILVKGKIQGASTIEQQLVRTITRHYERTFSRKLREIVLASILSFSFKKDDIARAYLSVAYFGWNMNGIEQACRRLSVNPLSATALQAAEIIARLKYPESYCASSERIGQIHDRVVYILHLQQSVTKTNPTKLFNSLEVRRS